MDEKELITKAKQGNKYCLNLLLQDNYKIVYGFLIKLTGDTHLSQDLVQETLLKATLNINKFKEECKFSTYLIQIAINTHKNYLRKNKIREKHDSLEIELSYNGESKIVNHLKFKEAIKYLQDMPYEKRTSFILKHYYGYSIEEISKILDVSQGTTKSRIHKTVKKLKDLLS
ncbi:sigma-70 family RNA polymerase sigma factor [Romboutsia weinsteinii]|uniref:Sigma-70 family RNA polymerase sigma factor n=1 Tax=Romboutsia weinsteinii TaxID=2020949 RepID=A0A371IYC9_9FIRM|nr:sigma-70 family RNA polymerase sigma factor [Romboutsia weinsteinii]